MVSQKPHEFEFALSVLDQEIEEIADDINRLNLISLVDAYETDELHSQYHQLLKARSVLAGDSV